METISEWTIKSTPTDALDSVPHPSIVALKSLCPIARLQLAAVLKELPRTNFAAPAAILHHTDSCGTSRAARRTVALLRARGWHLKQDMVSCTAFFRNSLSCREATSPHHCDAEGRESKDFPAVHLQRFSVIDKKNSLWLFSTAGSNWQALALCCLGVSSPFYTLLQSWRKARLKRCLRTMRGIRLLSSKFPIMSRVKPQSTRNSSGWFPLSFCTLFFYLLFYSQTLKIYNKFIE